MANTRLSIRNAWYAMFEGRATCLLIKVLSREFYMNGRPYATASRTTPAGSDRRVSRVSTLVCNHPFFFYALCVENLQQDLNQWIVKGASKIGYFQMKSEEVFLTRVFFFFCLIGTQGNTKEEILIVFSLLFLDALGHTVWCIVGLSQDYLRYTLS